MITGELHIDTALLNTISSEQAVHYRIIPKKLVNGKLFLLTDSTDEALNDELNTVLGREVLLTNIHKEALNKLLAVNYRTQGGETVEDLSYSSDFLTRVIVKAQLIGSSDILFETAEQTKRIRYRIDGKLKEFFIIPQDEYPIIVNQIKIKAGLDISEKRLPQDGRISLKLKGNDIDIRVSTLPTLYGEKIVLRLLKKDASNIYLENLGFSKDELNTYKSGILKPNGIMLISGPTGSGKTTTLYATLKELNKEDTNILTIEDPIEYTLNGINQVQLKESIGLDFTNTLKTFLRQDPDIIMVGEIRDAKTANMAIRAALTGHLVLSTIHTNSATATISRLMDMGIPPFLIAGTLNMSVAQRLIRRLCSQCKTKQEDAHERFPELFSSCKELNTHYIPNGCNACNYTGFRGRQAIYEIIPITNEVQEAIKSQATDLKSTLALNYVTLKDNALNMVCKGETSVEEVYPILSN